MENKFKVGDKVTAFGLIGIVNRNEARRGDPTDRPIYVDFIDEGWGCSHSFTKDGKLHKLHKVITLSHVEKNSCN